MKTQIASDFLVDHQTSLHLLNALGDFGHNSESVAPLSTRDFTPVVLADSVVGSGSFTPVVMTLVSRIASTCSIALLILKY